MLPRTQQRTQHTHLLGRGERERERVSENHLYLNWSISFWATAKTTGAAAWIACEHTEPLYSGDWAFPLLSSSFCIERELGYQLFVLLWRNHFQMMHSLVGVSPMLDAQLAVQVTVLLAREQEQWRSRVLDHLLILLMFSLSPHLSLFENRVNCSGTSCTI